MTSEMDIARLDISKNLLQMNFMKRTLIAKEKLTKSVEKKEVPSLTDFQFAMPQSVTRILSQQLKKISNRPVVRHVPGLTGIASFGLRASYGGFNPHLTDTSVINQEPSKKEDTKKHAKDIGMCRKLSARRSLPQLKRKSHGSFSPAASKRAKKKCSL